jgi:type I restriction enzyme S subunit
VQIQDYKSDKKATYVPSNGRLKTCVDEDIMIARYGASLGRILEGLSGAYNVALVKTIPDFTKLDRRYFKHFLLSDSFQKFILGLGGRAAQAGFNKGDLERLEIPLPPLDEQKRIAGILDQADALRRKRRDALALLDTLTQSIFVEMFGDVKTNSLSWDQQKLGELCKVGSSKRVFVSEFVASGVPFYRGTEVGQLGEGNTVNPSLFIETGHYENLIKQSGTPEVGDLLLPSICHDGRIWCVDHDRPFYFKDGRVLWIKSGSAPIDSEYLKGFLRTLFLTSYASIASGTTFAELKILNLKNLKVLVPPTALQNKFSNRRSKTEFLAKQLEASLSRLDSLFASLQSRAFSGDL